MITQDTASKIWACYREIEVAEKLLTDMEKGAKENDDDSTLPTLADAFGRKRHLELGIPSGENCHRLVRVAPELAKSVILSHIARQKAELVEANEQARIEMDTPSL